MEDKVSVELTADEVSNLESYRAQKAKPRQYRDMTDKERTEFHRKHHLGSVPPRVRDRA